MTFTLIKRLFSLVYNSKIIWKLIRNYRVLSESFKTIETVINNINNRDRVLPDAEESRALLTACSNILKTGVIDIPGVDEYELSLKFDYINEQWAIGLKDDKSGKFTAPLVVKKLDRRQPGKDIASGDYSDYRITKGPISDEAKEELIGQLKNHSFEGDDND